MNREDMVAINQPKLHCLKELLFLWRSHLLNVNRAVVIKRSYKRLEFSFNILDKCSKYPSLVNIQMVNKLPPPVVIWCCARP